MNKNKNQWIHEAVAEILDEDSATINDQENLFEAGLDSIDLLRLVNQLRRARIDVNFADLARTPTLAAWDRLIAAKTTSPADKPFPKFDEPQEHRDYLDDNTNKSRSLGVMQHAYWAGRSSGQRLGGVAAHLYVEFDRATTAGVASIEADRVHDALIRLIERHPTLRTRISADGSQTILPSSPSIFKLFDLTDRNTKEVKAHLESMRDLYSNQMLDIENGEVLSVALSLLPGGATRLHVDVDMIAADAVSYRILLTDFVALYNSPSAQLPSLHLTYGDYLTNNEDGKDEQARAAAAAWHQRLATLPGPPILPEKIAERDESYIPQVARRHIWLSPDRKKMLDEITRHNGVTPAMTIATILAEVVGYWSATDHFLLNIPMFNRPDYHPDIKHMVGDFSSSVMLEVDLRKPLTFLDRVRVLQQRMHHDVTHTAYTGLDLLRELSRQHGRTVLAPIVFTSALGLGELFVPEVTNLIGKPVWIISQAPQVLLDAQVTEFDSGLLVNWDSREDVLQPNIVDAMFGLFSHVLNSIIDDADAWHQPLSFAALDIPKRRLNGQTVRIVDRFGRDCPDHVVGLLQPLTTQSETKRYARGESGKRITIIGDDTERTMVYGVPVWPFEVEEAIRSEPAVNKVAILRHNGQFAAAVVLNRQVDGEMNGKALRLRLGRRIASHLLPEHITIMDALPRGSDGHIDQNAIRKIIADTSLTTDLVAPRSNLERVIANVWQEILGLEHIGVNEEFIALGGDSLLAARVVSRLRETLSTNAMTLLALFRSPNVAELAKHLRENDDPERLEEIASIILEIQAMSDEEVASQLAAMQFSTTDDQDGAAL